MRLIRTLACLSLCVAAATSSARADDLDEDFQVWTPIILQADVVPEVLRAWVEVQPRFVDDADHLGFVLWRPALGYYVTDWLTAWVGYAFVERHYPSYGAEHRIWEQLQASGRLLEAPRLDGAVRLRLEQRMQEGEDPVAHRLRLLVRGSIPLGDPGPPGFYAVVWNEVFVGFNTTHWGKPPGVEGGRTTANAISGLDQNRSFVGLGFAALRQVRVEAGYLFQYVHTRGDRDDFGNHILSVTLWLEVP